MKQFFRKIVEAIKRFFALQVINLFKKVYKNYPEGILASLVCYRDVYKLHHELRVATSMMYKDIATSELVLSVSLEPVKKGKNHYHVIVCKDRNLKTVFFLDRHDEDGAVTHIKESYTEVSK